MHKLTDIDQIISQHNIQALIFDCDGTIMDTLEQHYAAWCSACKQLQQPFIEYEEFLRDYAGASGAEMLKIVAQKYNFNYDISALIEHKRAAFINQFIYKVKPIEKVLSIAHKYHGKLKLAVASGGAQTAVEKMLHINDRSHLFDLVVTFDIVKVGKPAPDIFLTTAHKLGVATDNCLVFEDHHAGFVAAERAQMRYIDINQIID